MAGRLFRLQFNHGRQTDISFSQGHASIRVHSALLQAFKLVASSDFFKFPKMPPAPGPKDAPPPAWVGCLVMWLLSLGFSVALRVAGGDWTGLYVSGALGVLLVGLFTRAAYSKPTLEKKADAKSIRRS